MNQKQEFIETEIGKLPEDWVVKKVNQVTDQIFSGGTPNTRKSEYWDGNIPWLSSGETSNTFIFETERKITELGVKNSSTRLAKADDVVVASAGQGSTRGQVSFCMIDTYVNQSVVVLRANKEILEPRFLFYNLVSRYNELRRISDGHSSRGSLTTKLLADLNIQIPPIGEQTAIAKILTDLDLKIALNRQMNSDLEAIGQALFKHWFVDFEFPDGEGKPYRSSGGEMADTALGEIPKRWEVVRTISELCNLINYGYTQSSTEEKIGPKFLRVMDINKGDWIDWASVPYCEIEEMNSPKYLLEKGDIVVARMADPGKLAIFESDIAAVFASYLIRIRLKNKAYSYYLYYLMKSKYYQEFILGAAGGSVQKNLNAKGLTNGLPIIIPSDEEIDSFNKIISSLREKINENVTESINLSQIRDALLPKLMSGEIRVIDAEGSGKEISIC